MQSFWHSFFSEEYTDRERHAVNSEYSAKIRDDGRRVYAATQQAMNPAHPASRFAVGNLDTLPNDTEGNLRSDLINFYQRYYSANQMTLVIIGKQSLKQLESLITSIEDLANKPDETGNIAGCDHTFRFAEKWAEKNHIDIIQLYQYLNANGGFCDCEICFNVSELLHEEYEEET